MTRTALKNKELRQEKELKEKELAQRDDIERRNRWVGFAGNIFRSLVPSFKITKSLGGAGQNWSSYQTPQRNDPYWYKRYVKDLDKFTNVATFFKHGITDITFNINNDQNVVSDDVAPAEGALPGIFRINYIPMIGRAWVGDGYTSLSQTPFNNILMRTKEQVLKSNSRSSVNYEASDLGYNFIACGSIIQLICEAERALYVAKTYHATNNFLAKRLLTALGWNADNVLNNMAEFREKILIVKHRFNSALVCPADLTYYQRIMYVNGNVFADHDSSAPMSQMYVFVPEGYYQLSSDASELEYILSSTEPAPTSPRYSPIDWYNAVSEAITRIAETPDFQDMFSDLRSAFQDRIFQLSTELDDNGMILLNADEMNRLQIHNIQSLPGIWNGESFEDLYPNEEIFNIKQDDSGYIYQSAFPTSALTLSVGMSTAALAQKVERMLQNDKVCTLVDTNAVNVSGDEVIEYTRNKVTYRTSITGSTTVNLYLDCVGTELVTSFDIFDRANLYSGYTHIVDPRAATPTLVSRMMTYFSYLSTFDWAPMCNYTYMTDGTYAHSHMFWEVFHPFGLDKNTLRNVVDVCTQSLFYIDSDQFKR